MTEIGKLLRELRGKKSLRDVARIAGISHSYLSLVEKGVDPRTNAPLMPSPESLKGLSKALNYPYEKLLETSGVIEPAKEGGELSHEIKKLAGEIDALPYEKKKLIMDMVKNLKD